MFLVKQNKFIFTYKISEFQTVFYLDFFMTYFQKNKYVFIRRKKKEKRWIRYSIALTSFNF